MNKDEEIWATISDCPGYDVSSHGRVRNNRTGKLRRLVLTKDGYHAVQLRLPENGGPKKYFVSRAVYAAFIGPLGPGIEVDHLNFCRTDNRPSNLAAKTHAENIAHLQRAHRLKRKLSAEERAEIRRRRLIGERSKSLSVEFQVSRTLVDEIAGETKPKSVPWKKLSDDIAADILLQLGTPRRGLMSALARKYGVSQVAIKKLATKHLP